MIHPPHSHPLRRRSLLAGLVGGGLAAALPAWAQAPGGQITVSNWGGDWNERTVRLMEQPLVERAGIRIIRDLGMEPERKAKLLGERRLRRGTVDVVHLNGSDAFEMFHADVLAELDKAMIGNYADVVPALASPHFVPWLYSGVVILYNPDKVSAPPRSYADLWDARWAGKLGLTNQLYFNYVMMGGVVAAGNVTATEAGLPKLQELKRTVNPRIYATHQQLQAALANGEVDIAVNYKARGLQWINDGLKLQVVYPNEGAISVVFGAGMPKRAPNADAAYFYLNAMLDRKAMADLAAASFYAPANAKAELSAELRTRIDFTAEEQAKLRSPDYAHIAANTAAWLEWWNKNIAV